MSDQQQVTVAPMNVDALVGPGQEHQPFSVTLNLPNSTDLAILLRDTYGPILRETNDYRPLAAYIRSLVSSAVQQSIAHVQQQLAQAHQKAVLDAQTAQKPVEEDDAL